MPNPQPPCILRQPRPGAARNLRLTALLPLAALAMNAVGAGAQIPRPPVEVRPGHSLTRVHVDTPGDGYVWVLAPGYKARFGVDGVEYIPYFGAKAERSYPVVFKVAAITRGARAVPFLVRALPTVEGERIRFDRGAVTEVWDLRRDEVEQSFVVTDPTGSGDLVVRLDVRSDLAPADIGDGLRFVHPSLGHVHYGDVLAFDAAGRRVTTPSLLCAEGIELRVPASFADGARGTFTLDPVVRTVDVNGGSDAVGAADVAFEPTTGNWLVAYVRQFSNFDSDIITRRFNSAGDFLEEVVVASGSRESQHPSVAANGLARQFLIAWDEDAGVSDRVILARTRAAASASQGSTFTVLDTSGIGNRDEFPAVGGSIATDATGSTYAVLCLSDDSVGRHVSALRVTTGGAVALVGTASVATHDVSAVRITKARRNDETWMSVYTAAGAGGQHVHATDVPAVGSSFRRVRIDDQGDCRLGGIAGSATAFFVVYARRVGSGNSDIFGARVRSLTSLSAGAPTNLTAIEPGAAVGLDQTNPTLAFDGCRYTYAYQEAAGAAGSFDLFAAVVSVPELRFTDGHRSLHTASAANERNPRMASTGDMGGAAARSFVVFDRIQTNGNIDVAGTLFDGFSLAGGVTTIATQCGNHQLVAENEPALGGTLRLRTSRRQPDSQIFLIGLPVPPLALCAAGCALGVSPILVSLIGSDLDLPIPCGVHLIGGEFAVQNVFVGGVGGCLPPATPIALITSQTLVIRLR